MNDIASDLIRSLKATAGARFNASKRVAYLDRRLTALTAFTSAFLIWLTVLPLFAELSANASSIVGLFTVAVSVLILASSLLQYSCNFGVKSELFHRSALEIQELKRELQFKAPTITQEDFFDISARYNDVLKRYALNHDDVDFYRQQLEYPKDYPLGFWDRAIKITKVKTAYHYPTVVLVIVAALVVAVSIGSVFYI